MPAPGGDLLRLIDDVAENSYPGSFEFDHIARPDPPIQFEPATAGNRAHSQELAWTDRLAIRRPCQHLGKGVAAPAGISPSPHLAVDSRSAADCELIDFVDGQQAWTHDRAETFPLRWPDVQAHLIELDVAGADVVEDRDTRDMVRRVLNRDVSARLTDVEADLQLEIQLFGISRPGNGVARTEHGSGVALIADRHASKRLRNGQAGSGGMPLVGQVVADAPWPRHRCQQSHGVQRQDHRCTARGGRRITSVQRQTRELDCVLGRAHSVGPAIE